MEENPVFIPQENIPFFGQCNTPNLLEWILIYIIKLLHAQATKLVSSISEYAKTLRTNFKYKEYKKKSYHFVSECNTLPNHKKAEEDTFT